MNDTKLTFFSKNPIQCPVCENEFYREEIFTGRGRLIAGELTDELRRLYEASRKFGEINPLVYTVTVCPACYYGVLHNDFSEVQDTVIGALRDSSNDRKNKVALVLDGLDFTQPRTLKEGAASMYLAMACYDKFPAQSAPTIKMGMSAVRAAWLFSDLHRKFPTENYDYVASIFYHKSRFFYIRAVELEQTGGERLSSVAHLGPDIDKNYGFDGILYLAGLLEFKYGNNDDPEKRKASLEAAKRTVAKLFGMGKASKDKPSAILEKAKDLYDTIADELKEETVDAT